MNIALGYTDTYTCDPKFWEEVIHLANSFGHSVEIVTKRGVGETVQTLEPIKIHYTNRKAKLRYMESQGEHFDIWIDDNPISLFREG